MSRKRRQGFTLIELLVVVSIIALLISILLPSLSRARATAKTTVCSSNMRQIFTAFTMYAYDWDGLIPPPGYNIPDAAATYGYDAISWTTSLLPYLPSPATKQTDVPPQILVCPAEQYHPRLSGSYGINVWLGEGNRSNNPSTIAVIRLDGSVDGTNGWYRLSSTYNPAGLYMFADEGYVSLGQYPTHNYAMNNPVYFNGDIGVLRHPGPAGMNVAFVDGHIETLPSTIPQTYGKMPWWNTQ